MNWKINIKEISFLALIFSLTFCGCNQKRNLSTDDKLKIISEVLSDTTNKELFFKKCTFLDIQISNPSVMIYEDLVNDTLIRFESYPLYVSKVLKEGNLEFLNEQIKGNKEFKIKNLKNYGFNFQAFGDEREESKCYVAISKPLFNKNEDAFYLIIKENGSQYEYVFIKENDKWKMNKKFGLAIE